VGVIAVSRCRLRVAGSGVDGMGAAQRELWRCRVRVRLLTACICESLRYVRLQRMLLTHVEWGWSAHGFVRNS
jgi:hypothetical protein